MQRLVTIHKKPCPQCPSARPPDPEAQDIKDNWPRAVQVSSVFRCAWRNKLCKGYCDFLGVTEAEIAATPFVELG